MAEYTKVDVYKSRRLLRVIKWLSYALFYLPLIYLYLSCELWFAVVVTLMFAAHSFSTIYVMLRCGALPGRYHEKL